MKLTQKENQFLHEYSKLCSKYDCRLTVSICGCLMLENRKESNFNMKIDVSCIKDETKRHRKYQQFYAKDDGEK